MFKKLCPYMTTCVIMISATIIFIIGYMINVIITDSARIQETLAKYDCYGEWVSGINLNTGAIYRMYNAMLDNECYTVTCTYTGKGVIIEEVCDTD